MLEIHMVTKIRKNKKLNITKVLLDENIGRDHQRRRPLQYSLPQEHWISLSGTDPTV